MRVTGGVTPVVPTVEPVGGRSGIRPDHAIMFASGFAGLGYEMVWTRMLAVSLGYEIAAVLAVLAAFFVGLAVGAASLNGSLRRTARPRRWYAVLELTIGAWAIALVWLVPAFNDLVPTWIGERPSAVWHWTVVFGATLLLLLPATAAMGATLPAMERTFRGGNAAGSRLPGLYAANTAGAVAGTVMTTFLLAPALGYALTLCVCATVNLLCAGAILRVGDATVAVPLAADSVTGVAPAARRRLLSLLLLTGLLGLGYEVLVVRVLSQVLEDTVYTFAAVLSVYLLGTAGGAALYQRRQVGDSPATTATLLGTAAGACAVGTAFLWLAGPAYELISAGRGAWGALTGDLLIAAGVFLAPTLTMGALFSHLARQAAASTGIGAAVAWNTLGAAAAPLLAGVLLLPAVGARAALLLISAGYLALLVLASPRRSRLAALPAAWPVVVPALSLLGILLLPPLRFVDVPAGGELLAYREGIMASVAVVTDSAGDRHLKVNNHFTMGSTSSGFADHRQTHLPLLLHEQPRNALFLGVGTGMSMNAAQHHPDLEVTAVELVPETLALLEYFGTHPGGNDWAIPPDLVASDARRFVLSTDERFDVVIADLFHPSRDGAGSLYTGEHFRAIRARLNPGGLFCQWLPLFQMDLDTFKLIARSFAESFPHVQVHVANFSLLQPVVALVGSEAPLRYGPGWLEARVPWPQLQRQLVELRFNSDLALFGGFLGDESSLRAFLGPGPANSDDWPLVTYRAPRFAYEQRTEHGARLATLTDALRRQPATLLQAPDGDADRLFAERMQAYWQARDLYLRAGLGVQPSPDARRMLAQIREPLLQIVRVSPDFWPAYLPLLGMAEALYPAYPAEARALLAELDAAAPTRPEARLLLHALGRP